MITAYRNFANGGAKEHDERLLAKAQSLMQEDDPDVPDLLDFNDAPSRGDHGGVPDEGACVSSQTPASQSSLLD